MRAGGQDVSRGSHPQLQWKVTQTTVTQETAVVQPYAKHCETFPGPIPVDLLCNLNQTSQMFSYTTRCAIYT